MVDSAIINFNHTWTVAVLFIFQ